MQASTLLSLANEDGQITDETREKTFLWTALTRDDGFLNLVKRNLRTKATKFPT